MNNSTYRKAVEQMWGDERIVPEEVGVLGSLQAQLAVSEEDAASIEREVMGMTKEEAMVAAMGTNVPSAPATPMPAAAPLATSAADTLSGSETVVGGAPVPVMTEIGPGTVLGGRYEVLAVLGRGGMGQVLKVRDNSLDELRALKVLAPEHSGRADLVERMKRSARLCQKLRHPGIVPVFDFGVDEASSQAFFTMQYVEGQNLRDWLVGKHGEQASLDDVHRISAAIVEAVEYAHSQNVVHLDLKPENVMLSADESEVCILDFDISRSLDTQGLQTMLSGAGTPYYMAPEQEQGSTDVGPEADVYSLGAMIYEMLAGAPPRGNFQAPHLVRPEVPRSWSDAVMSALRPRAADRPPVGGLLRSKGPDLSDLEEGWSATAVDDREAFIRSLTPQQAERIRSGAESGQVLGQLLLAICYDVGEPLDKDEAEALRWYRKAAEQGHPEAQTQMGILHMNGAGVQEDAAEGARWFHKAAEQGDSGAQYNLGYCYAEGAGVAKDPAEAALWYGKAAEQGDADAADERDKIEAAPVAHSGGDAERSEHAGEGVELPDDGIMADAIDDACGTIDDLYLGASIPEKKLRNALATCEVPRGEKVRLLLDCTVFGSAKNALLVGERGIYLRNDWKGDTSGAHFVSWARFLRRKVRLTDSGEVLVASGASLNISGCSADKAQALALLLAIQEMARGA